MATFFVRSPIFHVPADRVEGRNGKEQQMEWMKKGFWKANKQ